MSDCAVNEREPYQGCGRKSANGETLNGIQPHDNPVLSRYCGKCNDYRFVTEYSAYRYGIGSAL